jgi:hypothetical protein
MIQVGVNVLPWYRLVLMVSHATDWCWLFPMEQIGADVLPWYRLMLSH